MRTITILALTLLGCVLIGVNSQAITPNSWLCGFTGINGSVAATKTKYKKMLTALNKDKNLKAQKTRIANFMNNNAKTLKSLPTGAAAIKSAIASAQQWLGYRASIVTFVKGLIAKVKPMVPAALFTKNKDMAWAADKSMNNFLIPVYSQMKEATLASLTNVTVRNKVNATITALEVAAAKADTGAFKNLQSTEASVMSTWKGCGL